MISIEKCKEYLGDTNMTDVEIKELRDTLYAFVESILDNEMCNSDNIEPCEKPLSMPESLP